MLITKFLSKGLVEEGYTTVSADNGIDGYSLAISGAPDLILLDCMLPGLSGLEICRRLRLEQIGTPIIFLTARDTVQETIEGLRCANDYIKKPFSFEELLERIKWRIRLLWFIDQGHKRSSELQRKIPDATRRVLNIQLKELEEHELVSKVIFPVVPPKVYSLTDFGKTLIPVIATIGNWGDEHEERLRSLILKRLDSTKHM